MRSIPLLALFLLSACATQQSLQSGVVDWQGHVERLSAIEHWRLEGKLGFRSPEQGGSASLNWSQSDGHYLLNLSGPFGAGAARIEGDSQLATLTVGEEVYDESPSLMAMRLVGAPIPVDALSWWVRGISSPDEPDLESFVATPEGLAHSFIQSGWQLSFDRYRDTAIGVLPGKISGQSGDYSFRLVIAEWQFPEVEAQ